MAEQKGTFTVRDKAHWSSMTHIPIGPFIVFLADRAQTEWSRVAIEFARALKQRPYAGLTRFYTAEQAKLPAKPSNSTSAASVATELRARATAVDQYTKKNLALEAVFARRSQLEQLLQEASPILWRLIRDLPSFDDSKSTEFAGSPNTREAAPVKEDELAKARSQFASLGGKAAHRETEEYKEAVQKEWKSGRYKTKKAVADWAMKQFPIKSQDTIYRWLLGKEKTLLSK